jgi:hypothetical protein
MHGINTFFFRTNASSTMEVVEISPEGMERYTLMRFADTYSGMEKRIFWATWPAR